MISRRRFLKKVLPVVAGAGILHPRISAGVAGGTESAGVDSTSERLKEILGTAPKARYWMSNESEVAKCTHCHESVASLPEGEEHERVLKCLLCAQGCVLAEGERGKCRARLNVQGELRSLVYGRPLSIHIDPIEKKPFYHFLPGSKAFSLCTSGCPLRCKFCQNWQISQSSPEDYPTRFRAPEKIVDAAVTRKSPVIAFTYNEPTVFIEYLTDIARIARKRDVRSVLVSCGFMKEKPLREMCEVLHAIKIDLKGFSEDFYRKVSSAALKPVLRSIRQVHKSGVHLEIVHLVVPTLNDSEEMLKDLVNWVSGELGPDVPIHFTRFHPDYKLLNLSPTPVSTLERAREIAMRKGLRYAFVGNVPGHPGNHTYCPSCKKIVVRRMGFFVVEKNLKGGACAFCKEKIAGVWA